MNKFITKLAKLFIGMATAASVGVAVSSGRKASVPVAADNTITFESASDAATNNSVTKSGITLSGMGSYQSTDYRFYKGSTVRIESTVGNITSVSFTFTNGSNNGGWNGSTASYSESGLSTTTWTKTCTSGKSGKQARVTRLDVTVAGSKTLSSIAVTTPPTKTTYYVGDSFESAGMVVTASYSPSGTADVTESCTFSPETFTTTGNQNVTVSYTEGGVNKTTTQAVVVNAARTLETISVSTAPTKTTYEVGDYFDPTGLVITRNYSSGPSDTYTYAGHTSEFTFSPDLETALTASDTSVTITYGGMTATQSIEIDTWVAATVAKGASNTYDCTVNGDTSGIRVGKSGGNGSMTITVPSTATKIKFYAGGWSGTTPTISFDPSAKITTSSFELESCSEFSGNLTSATIEDVSPYYSGEIALKNIAAETTFTVTATTTARFVIWGVKYSTEVSHDPDFTLDPTSLTLQVGGSSSSVEATVNEYLPNPQYSWAIKNGSDDCVTLSNTSSAIVTVAPRGTALSASATLVITVTSSSDNSINISKEVSVTVRKISSAENPYTVAEARGAIDANFGKTGAFVQGIISQIDSFSNSSITYWISDDGLTTSDQFEVYCGKGLSGADFSSEDDLMVGQHVIVCGNITLFSNTTYEFSSGSSISAFGTHTVTYELNEGSMTGDNPQTVSSGVYFTLPTPTRSGYRFDGWKLGDDDPIKGNTRVVSDVTFSAQWSVSLTFSSITIDTSYCNTTFTKGSTFSSAGLVVTAHYSEGEQYNKVLTTSDYSVSSPDMSTVGQKTITVSYTEGTSDSKTYIITVTGVVSSVSTTMPASLSLDFGASSTTYTATITQDSDVGAVVAWKSSDISVATVVEGVITASESKKGTASIIAFADVDKDGVLDDGEVSSSPCTVTVVDPNQLTKTWDLTTYSYSNSSADAVVWSDTGISATSTKVSGTTPANNYVPTSENGYSHTRFLYSGHTLSFKPDASYSIASIQITLTTESYAETVAGLSWNNATASSSGTVVTITPTDGTLTVSAQGSTAVRATEIYVEFTRDTTTKLLAITDSSLVVGVDASVSTTLVETNFSGGTYEVDIDECASVSISGTAVTVTGLKAGSYTFTISETTYDLDVELTVTVYDPSLYYSKLNSSSNIVTGDRFIIKASSYDEAFGGISSSFGQPVDIESNVKNDGANIDSYNLSEDVHIFTLISSGNANKYYLYDITGEYFLVGSSAATTTSTSATLSGATEWTITISSGVASISVGERSLMYNYNNGNGRFACYSNNMTSLNLYRISGSSLKDNLNTFQNNSLKMDSYDVGGSHGSTDGDGSCKSYYLPAKQAFNDLIEAEQQLFKTSSEYSAAKQRYEDWAVANSDGAPYDGNDDIQTQLSARILSAIFGENTNTVAIIVIISMVSVTAIGGYFFLRKRKEQ